MKKILFFIDNLGSGGAQRQIVNIASAIKNRGYDVEVLVYQDYPFYKPLLDEKAIPITLIDAKSKISRILRVRRYINKANADTVVAFLETPCFIACVSKIGHKKWKLVTNELSAKLSTFTSRRNKLFNWFERFSNAKVANSHNAIDMWRKYYPQYENKYSVIYNPVSIPQEWVEYPHEYRKNGKLRLTVAASYQALKNPLRVIEAVNALTDEQKAELDLHWYGRAEVSVGDTHIYDQAVKKVEEYGLGTCIHLHGESTQIYEEMAKSDAVGLFSTVEGLPNVICEAMTLRKPVVMSKVSDYSRLVTDNGFLCDPYSVESIKDALVALLDTPSEILVRMGQSSRRVAGELFLSEKVIDQWVALIEKI